MKFRHTQGAPTISVLGQSISGMIAACYLKKNSPHWNVRLIGKRNPNLPIVGESLTEFSTKLLHEIGMGKVLEEEHYHKYGLSFYFKEKPSDPRDRTYSVHEALAIPPMPANLINRFDFDESLWRHTESLGVEIVSGRISDVRVNAHGAHTVTVKREDGDFSESTCDWLIDATGRSRVLAKKLGLEKREPMFQRSSFWFWLVDFDESALAQIDMVKLGGQGFDSYYVTHHFMSEGCWAWGIPIRTKEHKNMISVGLVWRPDIQREPVTSVEEFVALMDRHHPVMSEFVRSGSVVDSKLYSNYFYETPQIYSTDRWFLVGDAGDTVDPLYSTGLVLTSLEVTQIHEIIRRAESNTLPSDFIRECEATLKTIRDPLQFEIAKLYEVMGDPYQCHWRVHFSSTYYFFFLLPVWLCDYMVDPQAVRWIRTFIEARLCCMRSLVELLPEASRRLGNRSAEEILNKYDRSVNWDLTGACHEQLPRYISRMFVLFASYRFEILRNAEWKDWPMHLWRCARDLGRAIGYRFFFTSALSQMPKKPGMRQIPRETRPNTMTDEMLHRYPPLASGM